MKQISGFIKWIFLGTMTPLMALIPKHYFRKIATGLIEARTASMSPENALRLLLQLDQSIYTMEGSKAVSYDKGVHVKHRLTRYHDFFIDRIRSGDRVLDVGCGTGALAKDIADRAGAKVVGIDKSEHNIEIARTLHVHPRVHYVIGDATEYVYKKHFDVVVLSNVLEHISDRLGLLRRLQSCLGISRMLIRVPLFERDWRVPLRKELGIEWRLDATHQIEYMPDVFRKEIEDAGMRIAESEIHWGEIWAEVTTK